MSKKKSASEVWEAARFVDVLLRLEVAKPEDPTEEEMLAALKRMVEQKPKFGEYVRAFLKAMAEERTKYLARVRCERHRQRPAADLDELEERGGQKRAKKVLDSAMRRRR